ncbi:MAG: tetratricopeptide repeat protein [Deltaproteobacteria bacterium]|nr:tetratricopeptide repeat protein [Deltaproteobacteria bacterium]
MQKTCSKCGEAALQWTTERQEYPIDVLRCGACGHAMLVEDWTAPVRPIGPESCTNCGDLYQDGKCRNCGLSREENVDVHNELRDMVDPTLTHLQAARVAHRAGRLLMALKLSTSAMVLNEDNQRSVARAHRIWLLREAQEGAAALAEAQTWVERSSSPSVLAWITVGQQLHASGRGGEAMEAYTYAIDRNPDQQVLRARRAELMFEMGRVGQAHTEVCEMLEAPSDDQTMALVVQVAEQLAAFYTAQERKSELLLLLQSAGSFRDRSAVLLAHQALHSARDGEAADARRYLKRARRLTPELPLYAQVDAAIKAIKSSWWRW